ncbi:hypothetical protein SteCoe_16291 [Stentor coeruleus]|uniref:Peptidase S11 D-alanyl-D-alanine carboxypeptidase A N-terminal domain-containing protein n=1 Tax=Stentor coeruleus TaxID=5963 RepID=A0A1R2C1I5_9CILI|nr:hypothetical protein SteCoe_16291 [Stentor coeruleus]
MESIPIKIPIRATKTPCSTLLCTSLACRRRSFYTESSQKPSENNLSQLKNTRAHFKSKSERSKRYHSQNTIPMISASSYCVLEQSTNKVLHGFNDIQIREVASLTKIMTCILCLNVISFNQMSLDRKIIVSTRAANTNGTTAGLRSGDTLTLRDLLYGLMLPSGNDAAVILAEYFGDFLYPNCIKPVKKFVFEMNKVAVEVGMSSSHFANPHGLMHKKNLACARDIGKLACYALRDRIFKEIVNCKSHIAEIRGKDGLIRYSNWKNTNKLLGKGFNGVKTGVTLTAGPCLCASVNKEQSLVIVLLNSKSMEDRWIDAKKLTDWALSKFY